MATQLSDLVIEVNNDQIGIAANSLRLTQGKGTQTIRAVSEGNGKVSQLYANDIEENFGKVMFSLPTTIENVNKVLAWQNLLNGNVVTISGRDKEGNDIQRAYTQCAVTNDPEINVSADGNIDVEFMGNAPT